MVRLCVKIVSGQRNVKNVWILWLKVLGLEVYQRVHGKVVEGDMKTLKLSKEDALVCSK